jgi:hypothetical protein
LILLLPLYHVTDGVSSGTGLTRLIALDKTHSIGPRQDGCQARRNEGLVIRNQGHAKTDANLREMKAEIRANNEKFEALRGTLVSRMDAHHAETDANHEELMATMKASHERNKALMDVSLETTEACLKKTEVNQGKVELKTEVPNEETAVEMIRALKDRSGD